VQAASAWDVADACLLAAEGANTAGRIYNLGSDPDGVPTVLEEVRALVEHAGTGSPIVRIPAPLLRTAARALQLVKLSPIAPEHYILADRDFVLDIRAAQQELGFAPQFDNTQMLLDAYDAYVRSGPPALAPKHPVLRLLDRIPRWGG
jgi:nucleoside-diphosphate-sugar epimerase